MATLLPAAATAVGLFAGTNVDDMVVLAVLNASSRASGRPKGWHIWAGQYAGLAALVIVSLAAARGLALVPKGWIWLLGLLPLSLGTGRLVIAIRARRSGGLASAAVAHGVPGVIAITVANGGDNLAAYTPVFATIGGGATAVTIVVFTGCVALWCLAGAWSVSHHNVTRAIRQWGHWIVPGVYILIGLYIFQKAGALARVL